MLDPMPRVDLPPSTDYLRGLEAGRVGTQAAVAAAMMMAAEVVYQFFDALSFDDEWSLEDLQAAILALITPDAMAALVFRDCWWHKP